MQSVFESIISRRRERNGRRGAIVLAAALAVFLAAVMFSSSPAYGAPEAKPSATKAAKKKPKVNASIRHGQLNVLGTAKSDKITLRLKPRSKSRLQVDVGSNGSAEFTFKRSAFNRIVVHGASGADALSINESYGVFTGSEATSLFGDNGNDLLRSGSAAERLFGGSGNDRIDGKRGNDLIEGGAGSDLVVFNGSNAAEKFEFSAIRSRLRFVGAGTMNIAGVEQFDLRASGAADNVVVNDLTGAGLRQLNADLANDGAADVVDIRGSSAANDLRVSGGISIGGIGAVVNVLGAQAANDKLNLDPGAGSDRVTVEGTPGNDTIGVAASATAPHIAVSGGSGGIPIDVVNAEALAVESVAGNDTLNAGLGLAALTQLTLDGGAGNDAINGGDGGESLIGGDGNDTIDGNEGADVALLGAGDDTFIWDPGDGSDKVEGEAGSDTMLFNGAAAAENFDLSANGNRLRFFRTQGAITMDTAGVERVDLHALGGSDNTVVNDLSATDVKNVVLDLAADGAVDTTTINGTGGNDTITITPNAGAVDVTGLAAAVKIDHSEAANDLLNVNGLDGNDTISGTVGLAALIKVAIDGGAGDDTINGGDGAEALTGGDGNDTIDGNGGNDLAVMGTGDDTFIWDPGDGSDTVEGQGGIDTMLFNGAAVAERIDLSANGNRFKLLRDPGRVEMDTAGVERVDVNALGGVDDVTVDDLSGTDVSDVNVDLAGTLGGVTGDGEPDSVVVTATNGDDTINVSGDASGVAVSVPPALVTIQHQEPANDALTADGLGGNDSISAVALAAQAIALTLEGGAGDDTIAGGQGLETLLGSDGSDSIDGNGGNDVAFMGDGDDTFVWDPGDGSDVVEGQDGLDTMLFNGAAGAEQVDLSANGSRLEFFRTQGNITMDTAGVELIDFNALAGADLVTVNDLTGTDVHSVNLDLAGTPGGATGDGQADRVVVNATNGDDSITVRGDAGAVAVKGLVPAIGILHPEAANDRLEINTLDGVDTVDATGLAGGAIQLFVNGVIAP